ncbi:hypothetical protein B0T19DRAFT_437292 [Cercophora scortea]|uniref:Uncharacterized protein n=1 Tax=Cercophora scortea TaxID=314031 RepID=A0AAE0J409_9PEZI|nr:hypothetical protein B0T19DRAFT_437292 [Cercophora scortea]
MASMAKAPSSYAGEQLSIVLVPDGDFDDTETVTGMESETEPEIDRHRKPETVEPRVLPAPQHTHPIPSMRDAFAESLIEATTGGASRKPKLRPGDAKFRRELLLDQDKSDGPPAAQWRFRPGQRSHELRRLMAQISFGVNLLLNGKANSQISVVSILQGHIDEVDEFLETTLEDMALATEDLEDRIDHLKLPMNNVQVFERMLEDRNFRLQIVEGNLKIEHIVARTEIALRQTMQDLDEGLDSTRDFTVYLGEQQHGQWRQERPDVIDIFDAMKGNTDGWYHAFVDLQDKATALDALAGRLTSIIAEIERRAGEVSRRTRFSIQPYTSPTHSPRGSDASSISTPPASPFRIPSSPPRLSLRLSSINKPQPYEPTSFFFDDQITEEPELDSRHRREISDEAPAVELPAQEREEEPVPMLPPARNPRRISERPVPQLDTPDENDEDDSPVYLLQPRTYTPQPPSPLPSPRVFTERPESIAQPVTLTRPRDSGPLLPRTYTPQPPSPLPSPRVPDQPPKPRVELIKPRDSGQLQLQPRTYTPQPPSPLPSPRVKEARPKPKPGPVKARVDPAPVLETLTQQRMEVLEEPRAVQQQLRAQPSRPKLVAIGGRSDPKLGPKSGNKPEVESEPEAQPKRTSLRQRVSLKTTPPESIQVPGPDAPELLRPSYPSPRVYQAPDSAYGSDMERPPVHSMASMDPSLTDFSPPVIRPGLLPSPHSDQQYFRPVQASPHSPLQQRPHTSGTVGSHHHHGYQHPPRNIPSAMGMSMLSNVTTASQETTGSGRGLKKKRSAFGWLKKAFSLDEEERAAFEQKRREQPRNPYYENKSPQFLDGRRIQPRPGY